MIEVELKDLTLGVRLFKGKCDERFTKFSGSIFSRMTAEEDAKLGCRTSCCVSVLAP
jgi:hypothetical protein